MNIGQSMFDGLQLFGVLKDTLQPVSYSKPMWPTKVRYLVNPAPTQNICSGVFFALPTLSVHECDIIDRAIVTGNKELDVPPELARKFPKTPEGYPYINELIYKNNKLVMNSRRCIVSRSGTYSIHDKIPTYSYNFVSLLCQYLIVALNCNDIAIAKQSIATIRANTPNFKHAPGVGSIGDTLVIAIDDIVYATNTEDFRERAKELLYSFYDPHSDLSTHLRF